MDGTGIQNILNKYGFQAGVVDGSIGPQTKAAAARFQTAYNMGELAIDGEPGPATQAALAALDASGGRLSPNFVYDELKCKHCGLCFINRGLLQAMERLRTISGQGMEVVDAYRCPVHNAAIGGAPNSMHPHGLAFDPVRGVYNMTQVRQAGFTGIGLDGAGHVDHLDIRGGFVVTFPDPGSG